MQCSVAKSLDLVGEWWSLLIVRDVFYGIRRFDSLLRRLSISKKILANRLAKLTDAGILEKRAYQERPVRYEYRLTQKGKELFPVILTLVHWGDKWMSDEAGPPVKLFHQSCGHQAHPQVVCHHCKEPLKARDIELEIQPHAVTDSVRQLLEETQNANIRFAGEDHHE